MRIPNTKKFEILYASNWYEGPISGLVKYKEKIQLFDVAHEYKNGSRLYNIYDLTDQERDTLLEDWKDFQEMVGTHWNFKDNKRDPSGVVHKRDISGFYKKHPPARYQSGQDTASLIRKSGRTPIATFRY